MLNLARFSVQRPVAAGIISAALLVLGVFYLSRMKVSLYPDVTFPFVNVTIPYPGASPEQIEATVVKPLETELAGLSRLSRIISIIRPSGAQVILGFKMSADPSESVEGVREKVNIVKGQFPSGVLEPAVRKVDLGAVPVLIYGIETDLPARQAKELLDKTLVRALQRADGVSDVEVTGVGKDIFEYQLDAAKLLQNQTPPVDLFDQIKKIVTQVPWGDVQEQDLLRSVNKALPSDSPETWMEKSVSLGDGRMVRLGDLGTFERTPDSDVASIFVNGKRGLGLVISKRADANTVETVHKASGIADNPNLWGLSPEMTSQVKLFPILNQAEFVEENANEVWIALIAGGAFAILIILLFLTDIKSALISATALPVSILGSFIFMSYFGFTLNMMSLLALALAIGLLIDDAVVVRESIYSELEAGLDPKKASVTGTDKVATAVLATTLAVIAVFLPVGAMDGMVGQFFKEFGITICIATAISTWVAFTLDPMLSAHFAGHPKPLKGRIWDSWRNSLSRFENMVSRWAIWSYDRWFRVIAGSVVLLIVSIGLSASVGVDFVAFEDRGQFVVSVRLPAGTKREDVEQVGKEVQSRLQSLEGLKNLYATVGGSNNQNIVEVRAVFNAKTERSKGLLQIQNEARERLSGLPGEWLVLEPSPIEGIGGEAPLTVFLYGDSIKEMLSEAEQLRQRILKIPGVAGMRIDVDPLSPGYEVSIKQENIALAGTDSQLVDLTGRLALTGLEPGTVGDDNLKFLMRLQEPDRVLNTLWDSILVPTQRGPQSLSNFATANSVERPLGLDREKRSRKITLTGSMDRSRTFGEVLGAVEKEVAQVKAPFHAEVAGDKEVFTEMIESFAIAILGSLFFIFIILAIQFENLLRPFIILLSLPLAMIGGFIALFAMRMQLAMGALIGLILLIGLAAKNGILLVDAIGTKESNLGLREAVRGAVLERTRPIVMTSMAMIFGMIPTAIMQGGGSEFRSPMAVAIMGGVVSSTLLSFLVIPAIFGLIQSLRNRNSRGRKSKVLGIQDGIGANLLGIIMIGLLSSSLAVAWPNMARADSTLEWYKMMSQVEWNQAAKMAESRALESASGAFKASRLALMGGVRVEIGREWYRPGLVQGGSVPLYTPDGPVQLDLSTTVIPQEQDVFTAGWMIPIFNLQALSGLKLASLAEEASSQIIRARREETSLLMAQDLFRYEAILYSEKLQNILFENIQKKTRTIANLQAAGVAGGIEKSLAEAAEEQALVAYLQARGEREKFVLEFQSRTGLTLKPDGYGLPSFPFKGGGEFKHSGLAAMQTAIDIQLKNAEILNHSFYPTVGVELGYQGNYHPTSTKPQSFAALRAKWDLLDGGARVRSRTLAMEPAWDLMEKKMELEQKLLPSFNSLQLRLETAQKILESAKESEQAATNLLTKVEASFSAGVVKFAEVRDAEEGLLKAKNGKLQAELALQAIHLESLYLSGLLSETLMNSSPTSTSQNEG